MGAVRFLLAVSIVCCHAGLGYAPVDGMLGMRFFYIVSGFLISFVLTNEPGYSDLRRFYGSRFLRIFPAYWAVAAAMLALRLVEQDRLAEFLSLAPATQLALAAANLGIFGQDGMMFLTERGGTLAFTADFRAGTPELWTFLLLPQGWSLAVELGFYLLAPFIVPRRRLLWAVAIGTLGLRAIAAAAGLDHDPWSYRFLPFEIGLFAAGALSHQLLLPVARAVGRAREAVLLLLGFLLVGPALGLGAVPVTAFFLLALPFTFGRTWAADRWLGELTYPLFLVHWPALLVCTRLAPPGLVPVATILLSVVAGAVLLAVVIDPVERLRGRLRSGATITGSAAQPTPGFRPAAIR